MYTIYTDGGCSGNPGPGGWGFVLLKDSVLIVEKSGGEKLTTNNKMELTAVIEALTFLKENGIAEYTPGSETDGERLAKVRLRTVSTGSLLTALTARSASAGTG